MKKKVNTHSSATIILLQTQNGSYSPIKNGNGTEWSPIWSVIIQVIKRIIGPHGPICYYKYDFRPNWTTHSSLTN